MADRTDSRLWVNTLALALLLFSLIVVVPIMIGLRLPISLVLIVWVLTLIATAGRLGKVLRTLFKPAIAWGDKRIAARGGLREVTGKEFAISLFTVTALAVLGFALIFLYRRTDAPAYLAMFGAWVFGLRFSWLKYKRRLPEL